METFLSLYDSSNIKSTRNSFVMLRFILGNQISLFTDVNAVAAFEWGMISLA